MQELRRPTPMGPFLCQADECDADAVHSWTRLDEHGNDIPVYGCPAHRLDDETSALRHQPECMAPPNCTCDHI